MLRKKIAALILTSAVALSCPLEAFADGTGDEAAVTAETLIGECSARSAVLFEAKTETPVIENNSEQQLPMGHLAKLMTVLITAEQIDSGEITLEETVKASQNANSQGGTQIWLAAGETITVDELLKAVTIGNANDACVALAERLCGSAEEFVQAANDKAVELGMESTHFEDVTGMDARTVSTASDVAKLACKLTGYDFLKGYFCTWMINVRGGQTELVNTNRLVRNYKGITGMKACSSEENGNCVVATAERNGMTMICVIIGSESQDSRFSEATAFLNYGFSGYEIYRPELPEEVLKEMKVRNGAEQYVKVKADKTAEILIPKGASGSVETSFEREEYLDAPVSKGKVVGNVRLVGADGVLFESELTADRSVPKMSIGLAFKRLWLNLLKLC